ncbi:Thiosulfate sulfurtransferase, rhodanese [Clostridiaceae bacterium JG1575]|nr:Thiosulfate sulfurtransferase, rhodanese [Clostridiaceae bacterium JG1575]
MKHFIHAQDLSPQEPIRFVDVRFDLKDPALGRALYEKSHLKGAVFLDLEKDLSAPKRHGTGNHPLPERNKIQERLSQLGLSPQEFIVLYDNGDQTCAPRAWFVLTWLGYQNVRVLLGGMKSALAQGFEADGNVPEYQPVALSLTPHEDRLVDLSVILDYSKGNRPGEALVDSRARLRYLGEQEPLYPVAGHIPYALNFPFEGNFTPEGDLRSIDELKERFASLYGKEALYVSCGSGVTACANYMAMEEAGLTPRLFVGSYSQWLAQGLPVETIERL